MDEYIRKNDVKTSLDIFYEMALTAFYDGYIAIYVDNKETADILYRFCFYYSIEMDYPNGEGCGIQINYTYKVAFVDYYDKHTGQKRTRRILLRYKGKNDMCGLDILNADNVIRESNANESTRFPKADVQHVKHGEWITKACDYYKAWQDSGRSWDDMPYFITGKYIACSECFTEYDKCTDGIEHWIGCPCCLTRMDGDAE